MNQLTNKKTQRSRRRARIRSRVSGTKECPRLAVFRSNRFVYAQLIDDEGCVTLAAADAREVKGATPTERANVVGQNLAKKASALNIKQAVFDRGGFLYAGAVKAVAEGARFGGLKV